MPVAFTSTFPPSEAIDPDAALTALFCAPKLLEMNAIVQGVLLAILSAFVFGFYMTPRKRSSLDDFQFPASIGIGILLTIAAAAVAADH